MSYLARFAPRFAGTSLVGCVRDIVDRGQRISDVDHILVKRLPADRNEAMDLVSGPTCQRAEARAVAARLFDEGRIVQGAVPALCNLLWIALEPGTQLKAA